MKTKASTFLKKMVSTIVAVVKAKSTELRAKTSTLKTRLMVLGILRNKRLLSAINHKIHAIMGLDGGRQDHHARNEVHGAGGGPEDGGEKAMVLYTSPSYVMERDVQAAEEEDSDDEYLRHSLFGEEEDRDDELVNAPGSVSDVVRDAKEKDGEGAEFLLEDEIDHVAEVFIRRIHNQLKMQKLESFKRFCEMMERSA